MFPVERIGEVQQQLASNNIDGWLVYDFQKRNELAWDFLAIRPDKHLTRRFFYWIPKTGEPVKVVHEIESMALEHLPGQKKIYLRWQTLEETLKDLLKGSRRVAMEYSPRCAVPYISRVDGGTIDLVRSTGCEVVSSAPFLQQYTSVLNQRQVESLMEAGALLEKIAEGVWSWIAQCLKRDQPVTDFEVVQWIANEFALAGFESEALPHCAINADSADPHFAPSREKARQILPGDFILIDLWCKKKQAYSVYADITRVGIAADRPAMRQQEIFNIVRKAQKAATDFVSARFAKKETVKGYEVDEVCRKVIDDAGYGKFFTHRTGHSITGELHGPGTHLDSLETYDDRPLLAGTCCSCEPGIYLPGEFGLRLEYDLYITLQGDVRIVGGVQETLRLLI